MDTTQAFGQTVQNPEKQPVVFLRVALACNGVFSGTTGLLMALAPYRAAEWIGSEQVLVLRLLGTGLLGFASLLLYLAFVARRPQLLGLVASMSDFVWVLGTVALAVVSPSVLDSRGWVIAWVVALIVLACGITQSIGIDRSYRHRDPSRKGWLTLGYGFSIEASARRFWDVVRSIGSIDEYSSSLTSASIIEPSEDGGLPVRECRDHRGKSWREVMEIDDERMCLRATFQTERPGFPFPFKQMEGGWIVEPTSGGSLVLIWWDVVPKRRWSAFILLPLMSAALRRPIGETVAKMCDAAVEKNATSDGFDARRILASTDD